MTLDLLRLRVRDQARSAARRHRFPDPNLGRSVTVARSATLNGAGISVGDQSTIDHSAYLATFGGFMTIGRRCWVNPCAVPYGHGALTIGDDVLIAAHALVIPATHRFESRERAIRD